MSDTTATGYADPAAAASADQLLRVSQVKPATPAGPQESVDLVEFVQSKVLDEANITEIGGRLNSIVDANSKPRLLLDFATVEHLSSAALGMLINVNSRIREKNGQLRLCNIRRQIMEVFSITKLDTLFKILPDRDAALASFAQPRA